MSYPLPVGDTLNEALQFGLRRWATMIRYGWAAIVASFLLIGVFFVAVVDVGAVMAAEKAGASPDFNEIFRVSIPAIIGLGVILYILIGILYSGVMASVFRLVALGEERPGLVNLRFDGPAMRVFWATLISAVISLAIWAAAYAISLLSYGESISGFLSGMRAFFSAAIAAAESGTEPSFTGQEEFFGFLKVFLRSAAIALIPLIYVSVRLAPFIAGSAAENRLILFGSFQLTKGRFWSVLGAMIMMVIVMLIISIVFELVSSILELLMNLGQNGGVFAIIALVLAAVYFALLVFYYAFVYGAQLSFYAIIYRKLKTGE